MGERPGSPPGTWPGLAAGMVALPGPHRAAHGREMDPHCWPWHVSAQAPVDPAASEQAGPQGASLGQSGWGWVAQSAGEDIQSHTIQCGHQEPRVFPDISMNPNSMQLEAWLLTDTSSNSRARQPSVAAISNGRDRNISSVAGRGYWVAQL